jgi:predicted tellurium resistance membrane protein TerC
VIKLMDRFPMIITAGGMLLGWIAGGMLVTDPAFVSPDKWTFLPKFGTLDERGLAVVSDTVYWTSHIVGALVVLALGKFVASRRSAAMASHG